MNYLLDVITRRRLTFRKYGNNNEIINSPIIIPPSSDAIPGLLLLLWLLRRRSSHNCDTLIVRHDNRHSRRHGRDRAIAHLRNTTLSNDTTPARRIDPHNLSLTNLRTRTQHCGHSHTVIRCAHLHTLNSDFVSRCPYRIASSRVRHRPYRSQLIARRRRYGVKCTRSRVTIARAFIIQANRHHPETARLRQEGSSRAILRA